MKPSRRLPLAILFLFPTVFTSRGRAESPWSAVSGAERTDLIELYSSEGCSSCPPADHWLAELRKDPDLWKRFVPLGFHVDYWNRLGWVDRFSNPAFTERQHRYAAEWKSETVYTPEFVLNGSEWKSQRPRQAGGAPRVPAGILKARQIGPRRFAISFKPLPDITGATRTWTVHGALLGNGFESDIGNGENSGRKLSHEFVVMALGSAPMSAIRGDGSETHLEIELTGQELKNKPKSRSVAFWVTQRGSLDSVQAVGGDLP